MMGTSNVQSKRIILDGVERPLVSIYALYDVRQCEYVSRWHLSLGYIEGLRNKLSLSWDVDRFVIRESSLVVDDEI